MRSSSLKTRGHETFDSLDHYLWQLTYKWAPCHDNKPIRWVVVIARALQKRVTADEGRRTMACARALSG